MIMTGQRRFFAKNGQMRLAATILWGTIACFARGGPPNLVYEGSQPLPNVRVNGQFVRIHTQGLLVTARHFYVSGRLEREPRRALLLRFDREDPQQYEHRDITPQVPEGVSDQLDHPGGFDGDERRLIIPVGPSKPAGPSVILSVEVAAETPLAEATVKTMFQVNDHIGAVAWDRSNGMLYGASWDTRRTYVWDMNGKAASEIKQEEMTRENPNWRLAVQDWKVVGDRLPDSASYIVASGIDKSPAAAPNRKSVIELLDVSGRRSVWRAYPALADSDQEPMTREGFDIFQRQVFLLPADLGRDAHVFRYRMSFD